MKTMFPLSIEERNGHLMIYSDFHKDAYGYRPRWNYSEMSDEDILADFKTFSEVYRENARLEKIAQARAVAKWDELVVKTIEFGAGDKKTALRWLWDGSGEAYDVSYFLWELGINSYSDRGKEIENEILEASR